MTEICNEWGDDQRMDVMFAPLRNKEVNPESWKSKIDFWIDLVFQWCEHNKTCIVDVEMLKRAFTRKGRTPHCIPEVLSEAMNSGAVCSILRYRQAIKPRSTWAQWAAGLMRNSLHSSLVGDPAVAPGTKYVVTGVADALQTELLQKIIVTAKEKSGILTLKQSLYITENQMNVIVEEKDRYLLDFLIEKGKLASSDIGAVKMFKIVETADSYVEFDEVDGGIIQLSQTVDSLEREIFEGEKEIRHHEIKIKEKLKSGVRVSAKALLVNKKHVEKRVNSKVIHKINAETLLDQIKGAESNKSVIEAYKSGLAALKEALGDVSEDIIDETMSDMAETVKKNENLSTALSNGVEHTRGITMDDEDLEEELGALVNDVDEEAELLRALDKLETEFSPLRPNKVENISQTLAL